METDKMKAMAEVVAGAINDIKESAKPQTETVRVVIRGISGYDDTIQRVSMAGGTLEVELFCPATAECKIEYYDIPSDGVVELKIPFGWHYSVCSKKPGIGASFRVSYVACQTYVRWIHLWNLTLGVYKFGCTSLWSDTVELGRVAPILMSTGDLDPSDFDNWDVGNGTDDDWEERNGMNDVEDEYVEETSSIGIVVSTADASFLVCEGAKSSETLVWSKQAFNRTIPGLEEMYVSNSNDDDLAQSAAKADYNGNLNTSKIVAFLSDCPAVKFASDNENYQAQRYLPSAGELYVLYQNKAAFNAIQADYTDIDAIDTSYYWSSSACSPVVSWGVGMANGRVGNGDRYISRYVLAFSAFTYNY